jgi:hypothetical protein
MSVSGWTGRLATVARVLLGLIFTVFGLNGFLNFIPQPPMPPDAVVVVSGLLGMKYLFPLLKGVEVVSGLLLLSGRLIPLVLVVLAPIILNIVGFHTFVMPDPVMPILLLVPELYLAWVWRDAFRSLFATATAPPRGAEGLVGGPQFVR